MSDPMLVPLDSAGAEHVDRGSRFIGVALPLQTVDGAREHVKKLRQRYPDSSHVVNAWRVGSRGDVYGYTDDGEPRGTAGRPVFEVLKGSGVTNVFIAVVRYFGGTKLGTGGLVRAYTETAKRVVAQLRCEPLISRSRFHVSIPYPLYEQVKRLLIQNGARISGEEFAVEVIIEGDIPEDNMPRCAQELRDLSAGTVDLSGTPE